MCGLPDAAVIPTALVHITSVPITQFHHRSPSMTLSERLVELVRAAFSGIWIRSSEHEDALAEIARTCRAQGWNLAIWDVDRPAEIFHTLGLNPLYSRVFGGS